MVEKTLSPNESLIKWNGNNVLIWNCQFWTHEIKCSAPQSSRTHRPISIHIIIDMALNVNMKLKWYATGRFWSATCEFRSNNLAMLQTSRRLWKEQWKWGAKTLKSKMNRTSLNDEKIQILNADIVLPSQLIFFRLFGILYVLNSSEPYGSIWKHFSFRWDFWFRFRKYSKILLRSWLFMHIREWIFSFCSGEHGKISDMCVLIADFSIAIEASVCA